jgi:prepilin-type N-terminal cleavage/methylation domain-containing protein
VKAERGFTLIELMIVTVIVGVLAAIGLGNFASLQDRAREASTKANAHSTQLDVEGYAVDHDGTYPTLIGATGPPAGGPGAHLKAPLEPVLGMIEPTFENPFSHVAGVGEAWEFVDGAPSPVRGIVSYQGDGATYTIRCVGANREPMSLELHEGGAPVD